MKKQVVLVLLALVGTLSTYAQVSFGVKAGYNNSGISGDASDLSKRLSGFHAGGIADITLAENFSLQPQLLFIMKGVKSASYTETIEGIEFNFPEQKLTLNYLELPVNFMYKHEAGAGSIFVGAGPYLGFGLSGKAKASGEEDGKVKFDGRKAEEIGEDDEATLHLKRLDAGANFLAGYELKNGLLFSVNYSLGLTNLDPDGGKSKNNYFGVSVGYLFKTKKK
ncbi:porin family protein [uncultured Chitinophaga sp.]|jgi:hypothetical protein|uniref:porin family protein n=1 Tax=uncultured Chitinophaga sp. TaxID=339340 RepID=UPI002615F855|nr:porin family protein [uncultured Chitinophaga sp.]